MPDLHYMIQLSSSVEYLHYDWMFFHPKFQWCTRIHQHLYYCLIVWYYQNIKQVFTPPDSREIGALYDRLVTYIKPETNLFGCILDIVVKIQERNITILI